MTSVPPPYPFPPAAPAAEPGALGRMLAGVLGVFAAVLVLAGSFLPVWSYEASSGGKVQSAQSVTSWTRLFGIEPTADERAFYESTHVAHYGIPLTVIAVVLLTGAVLVFTRARRAGRAVLVAGGAGAVAAVWMLAMDVSATLSYERQSGTATFHYASGTGFWVLLAGGIVALVTLGLALFPGRARAAGAPPSGYPAQPFDYPVSPPYRAPIRNGPVHSGPFPPPPPNDASGFPPRVHNEPVSQPFPPQPMVPPSQPPPGQPEHPGPPEQEEGPGRHRSTDEPST